MPDFSKGKIYKIFSPSTNLEYIGSTTQTLGARFRVHKSDRSCSCSVIFEVGDAEIVLIHDFPCDSLDELETEEGRVQDLYPDKVNIYRAGRSLEEKRLRKNSVRRVENLTQVEVDIVNKIRQSNLTEEQREHRRERERNLSREQRDKMNKKANEKYNNMTQEERDAKNKARRERAAKKREAAKTNSLDVSN